MNTIIRKIRPEEHDLLREFLYQAIYLPEGVEPPPRSVVDLPELQVYVTDFVVTTAWQPRQREKW